MLSRWFVTCNKFLWISRAIYRRTMPRALPPRPPRLSSKSNPPMYAGGTLPCSHAHADVVRWQAAVHEPCGALGHPALYYIEGESERVAERRGGGSV